MSTKVSAGKRGRRPYGPGGKSSTDRRASLRGEGYRYGSTHVLRGYSVGRPRDDTDDEPSSRRFGSGLRGEAGSGAEEDNAALERQRSTYNRFHHEATVRYFPISPALYIGHVHSPSLLAEK